MKKLLFLLLILYQVSYLYANDCSLTYGVYPDYAPYEWVENGKYKGVNIALINAVAQDSGCDIQFVSYPWESLKEKLKNGEITIVSSSINSETLEYASPLPTTFAQYRVLLGRKDAAFVYDLNELEGKSILVLRDSISYNGLSKTDLNINYYFPSSEREALKVLSEGGADYAFIDNTQTLIGEFPDLIVASDPMFATLYGFIVRNDSPYYKRLNDTIESLKASGKYYKIIEQSKDSKYARLLKIFLIIFITGLVPILFIVFWNKSLQHTVRQKTKSLNARTNLLQTVLSSIPEIIYVIDRDFKVLWHNNTDNPKSFKLDEIQKLDNIDNCAEFSLSDDWGRTWKILLLKFEYESQDNLLLVASDITENIKLRDELFMTSRYSALGEMATVIAHEINNPLGCVLHNFDYIESFINEPENEEEKSELESSRLSVQNSLQKIQTIVSELKGYTSRRVKEYAQIRLDECLKSAVGITRFLINKHTSNFIIDIKATNTLVYGSYGHIEQIIINVIQNACYALTQKSQKISCVLEHSEDFICLIIADEGIGMERDVLESACKAYFTTRKDNGGTGLGLSLTSRLIKEHGGYMDIKSEYGKGTEIRLFFPCTHAGGDACHEDTLDR